jgi:hypothetical protein
VNELVARKKKRAQVEMKAGWERWRIKRGLISLRLVSDPYEIGKAIAKVVITLRGMWRPECP